jgi:hypothetical protein
MNQARRARTFVFESVGLTRRGIRFFYRIDGRPVSYFSATRDAAVTLGDEQRYLVAANIGLAYLIDLATLCVPEQIVVEAIHLAPPALGFWRDSYRQVAVERIYAEGLDVSLLDARWVAAAGPCLRPQPAAETGRALLAMSGGKESLTALQLFGDVERLGLFFLQYPARSWFHLNRVYERLRSTYDTVKVRVDMDLSDAIAQAYGCRDYYTFVIGQLICHALLFGDRYRYVIIGNEYSSNFGNATYQGRRVNHQYDKSLRFARRVNAYTHRYVQRDFTYFSPFFGLYEYRIAQLFFADPRHLPVWTSCNFSSRAANFCGRCPKCAFTYLLALPFTGKAALRLCFPTDLMQDLALVRPLMETGTPKPLECVGEKEEVWLSLYEVWKQGKDCTSPVMRHFLSAVLPRIEQRIPAIERKLNQEHTSLRYVPDQFKALVRQALVGTTRSRSAR